MFTLLTILVCLIVISTVLPLSHSQKWWIRDLDFPRLQLAVFCAVLLVIELVVLELPAPTSWLLIVATASCLAYQAWWILPYTKLLKPEVKLSSHSQTSTISIITTNVLMSNRNVRKLLDLVNLYQPDILVTLESNGWWQSHLDQLEGDYPYSIKCPLENRYGMHLYSKYELKNAEIQYLVEDHIPSIHTSVILNNQQPIRLHCLHPAPPAPNEHEESAERDAELVMVAKNIQESNNPDIPIIVTGDMNDVAWSRTTRLFRKISGLLDPRIGRGMFNTFHADYWFMRWPLDHLFHSEHFTLVTMKRMPGSGSDHFALYTELSLEPRQATEQSGIVKEAGDEQLAQEKLAKRDASSKEVANPILD